MPGVSPRNLARASNNMIGEGADHTALFFCVRMQDAVPRLTIKSTFQRNSQVLLSLLSPISSFVWWSVKIFLFAGIRSPFYFLKKGFLIPTKFLSTFANHEAHLPDDQLVPEVSINVNWIFTSNT